METASFRRWLELWLARMVGHATGPVQPAFQALSYCIKQDTPLMLFMLPQVRPPMVARVGK
jgi:hypothetical protein